MRELQRKARDAALTRAQESLQRSAGRSEHREHRCLIGQLGIRIAAMAETLRRCIGMPGIAPTPQQSIQIGQRKGAEASRETRARQTQRGTDAAHSHRCETTQRVFGPAQRRQG